jgi:hypothetical protein
MRYEKTTIKNDSAERCEICICEQSNEKIIDDKNQEYKSPNRNRREKSDT